MRVCIQSKLKRKLHLLNLSGRMRINAKSLCPETHRSESSKRSKLRLQVYNDTRYHSYLILDKGDISGLEALDEQAYNFNMIVRLIPNY